MSEQPKPNDLPGEAPQESDTPEVYNVSKRPDGWSVSRRSLFAIGATAVAAAATAGVVAEQTDAEAQPVRVSLDRSVRASASGSAGIAWRLTNNTGSSWGAGTRLVVETAGEPLSLPVPEAAVGETVSVRPEGPVSYSPASRSLKAQLVVSEAEAYNVFLPLAYNQPTPTPPGESGEVPGGQTGSTISGPSGQTRWLPCGSEIPEGWTCICNCVTACICDGDCSCNQVCTCDTVCSCVGNHYWYPN